MTGSITTINIDANEFPVSSVVIFRTQAEVTRSFPIELQAGNNDLEIKGLPTAIQHDSLRIQGVGKGVTLLDHAISAASLSFGAYSNEPAKVKELRTLKKAAEAELKVLSAQADILLGYSKSITSEHVEPEAFMEYMDVFSQAGMQNVAANKEKEKEIEEIDAQIKKELESSRTSSERNEHLRRTIINLVLHSETDLKAAELKITYVVNGASWTPAYEIRATTDANGQLNKTVALHYKAAIAQHTGEDWKNTKLTLNTTSPALARVLLPHTGLKLQPGAAPNGQNGGYPNRSDRAGWSVQQINMLRMQQQQLQQQQQQQQQVAQTQRRQMIQQQVQQQQMQQQQMQQQQMQQQQVLQQAPSFQQHAVVPQGQQLPATQGLFGQTAVQPQSTGLGGFGAASSTFGGGFGAPSTTSGFGAAPTGTSAFGAALVGASAFGSASEAAPLAPISSGAVDTATIAEEAFNYTDAVAESTAVSATYKIEGKTTILSGIATHKVVISTSTVLPIEVYAVTMPRVQPWASLQAKIKNTRAEPLLAGPASIFNDDSYVSSTQLPLVSPGESFICSLGMDDKVRVSFTHTDGKTVISNLPFVGNTESVLATNTIKVKNNRNGAISRLIIRDAIPVGQDPLKVLLKTPADLATVASVDTEVKIAEGAVARWSKEKPNSREEGLVEWVLDEIQSGEEKNVELAWSVEVPQGFKWSYSLH